MSDKTYNGHTNYETWIISLWIDNEEGSHRYWNEQADDCWENADPDSPSFLNLTREVNAARDLADRLKNEIEENAPEVSGLYADLINAALSEVDWRSIAENMIEEAKARNPEDDKDEDE